MPDRRDAPASESVSMPPLNMIGDDAGVCRDGVCEWPAATTGWPAATTGWPAATNVDGVQDDNAQASADDSRDTITPSA